MLLRLLIHAFSALKKFNIDDKQIIWDPDKGGRMKIIIIICGCILICVLGFGISQYKNKKGSLVIFHETKDILANPYKGFVPMLFSMDEYEKKGLSLPVNMVYVGITWGQLEPEEPGKIHWQVLEEGFEQQIEKGRMIGIRFKVADPWVGGDLDVPEWLIKLGVGVQRYNIDGGTGLIPDWDNPIFLEHHKRMIKEIGNRYKNNPHIAWVDIGSYGIWGEWHHYQNEHLKAKKTQTKKTILEHYLNPPLHPLMVIPFDDDWARVEVLNAGQGLRNDCLGPQDSNKWFYDSLFDYDHEFWEKINGRTLITGEFCGSDEGALKALREDFHNLVKFIHKTHWSFIGPAGGNLVISKNSDLIKAKELYQQLGYHFIVQSVTFNSDESGGIIKITNTGSSAFPLKWNVTIEVDNIEYNQNVDIRDWVKGEHKLEFKAPIKNKKKINFYISDPNLTTRKIQFNNIEQKNGILEIYLEKN